MSKKLTIGLFGYGCVGKGLYEVLQRTPSINATVQLICVKDKLKSRDLPSSYFTYNKFDILNNPDIDVVVELIDDADEAFELVKYALQNGKAVVTANKKMLANHFKTLTTLAQQKNVPLLYEASVGGSIPIIRSLEEYYNTDTLSSVEGILNGTTNYILTKTLQEQKSYQAVLKEAQDLGFAESNPTMDVQAFDPKFKLVILLAHAFGLIVQPDEILNSGIEQLSSYDIQYAQEKGYRIKLIAQAVQQDNGISACVLPRFVLPNDVFYEVNNEFNAVQVSAAFSDKQLLTGKGAGSFPTAAAVLSDIAALGYNYSYEHKKISKLKETVTLNNSILINIYLRYTNDSIFEELTFESVSEEFRSKQYKYIIGRIALSELVKAKLNTRTDVFVAQVVTPIENFTEEVSANSQTVLASIH